MSQGIPKDISVETPPGNKMSQVDIAYKRLQKHFFLSLGTLISIHLVRDPLPWIPIVVDCPILMAFIVPHLRILRSSNCYLPIIWMDFSCMGSSLLQVLPKSLFSQK